MNEEQTNIKNKFNEQETINLSGNQTFNFNLSKNELDILFKYLSRTELKGVEVPEFNALLNCFKIKNV